MEDLEKNDKIFTEKKPQTVLTRLVFILVAIIIVLIISLIFIFYPRQISKFTKYFLGAINVSVSVDVGNVLPLASSASLNAGNAITLTENTTTVVAASGTVTDNNSCKDLASVSVAVYKDGTTCTASGNADNNNCYFYTYSDPTNDASCTGDTDVTFAFSYNFNIQYYATGGNWKTTVYPVDVVGAGTSDTSAVVVLNDLQALSVGDIAYGSVSPGSDSTGDHTSSVTNTGNTAIDFKIAGTDLTCTTRGSIPVANEQYGLASFIYGAGTTLSGVATDVNSELPAPTSATAPVTDVTYWQVSVPNGTKGTCSGTTTFTVQSAL